MLLWMMGGYVLAAVAFYTYIVKTAQEEPQTAVNTLDLSDWKKRRAMPETEVRKAA